MRWEDKLYHDCFALTRKTYVFPQESLHSLAKVLCSPRNVTFAQKQCNVSYGNVKLKHFLCACFFL